MPMGPELARLGGHDAVPPSYAEREAYLCERIADLERRNFVLLVWVLGMAWFVLVDLTIRVVAAVK